MNRIALLEDHDRLAQLVCRALAGAGIECDVFHRVDAAWLCWRDTAYAAWVVDRGLPDGDGLDLVRRLRAAGRRAPCLMLTARDALHDRIDGLESGADDYLVKPFPMDELVARVRALMRRTPEWRSLSPSFGDLRIEPVAGRMACGEDAVTLAPAEMQIMLSLVRQGGHTVRRSTLETAAWGMSEAVTPNALEVALHRLRKKLLAVGARLEIHNTRGHGYALRQAPLGTLGTLDE